MADIIIAQAIGTLGCGVTAGKDATDMSNWTDHPS